MIIPQIYMKWINDVSIDIRLKKAVIELKISCWLWDLRGLEICKQHGFYSQSWINGICKKCVLERRDE